jgi:hypothetical protein
MGLKAKIASAVPWIEPVLDYFDWRKRLVAGLAVAAWSFMKDLPWPVIFVLGFGMIVFTAYGLAFPAFIKLINTGVQPRPNHTIWRHKREFSLIESAFLLADREPNYGSVALSGDAAAWYALLHEAISKKEIANVPTDNDDRYTDRLGNFNAQPYTLITVADLKKFCEPRERFPEFLRVT